MTGTISPLAAVAGRRLLLAGCHRYPDLARLWHRAVRRDLVPALEGAGLEVEIAIFCDGGGIENDGAFDPARFPGARLVPPGPGARDFVEAYDRLLGEAHDFLFLLDADVFFLDREFPASLLPSFSRPEVAAVSYLRRNRLPGVYALLARAETYHGLSAPVFAARYEGLTRWPQAVNLGPGEAAAAALRARGFSIVEAEPEESAAHLADFHGTTVLRVARAAFAAAIGEPRFTALVGEKRYFAMGAYDNLLLGALYQALFGEPFAPDPPGPEGAGEPCGGSLTADALRDALAQIEEPERRRVLAAYFARSRAAIARLAAREGIELALPAVIPASWAEERRAAGAAPMSTPMAGR
jgi:hypothetical protein